MPNTLQLKPALRWMHRWFGLTLGVVFVIVSLSGTLLLFQPQFFRWAHGELIPEGLPQQVGSIDRWVENARAAVPQLHGPTFIWAPQFDHNVSDAGMMIFEGLEPGGFGNMGLAGVLVAPATGEVLGVVDVDRSAAYAPIFLHRDLWAGNSGQLLSAIMAIGAIIMLPVGLYLWWPSRGRMLQKLSPRPWRTTLTRAGRMHDVAGAWTVLILLVLAFTGLYMVRDEWVEPVLDLIPAAPAQSEPGAAGTSACTGPIGFDTAIARARTLVPSGTWVALVAHDEALRSWELMFKAGDSESAFRETHVAADLECGTVAIAETPENRAPRDSTELWLMGLHDGSAFGTVGQIIVTIVGLVPLLLLWSGIRIWMRRRGWLTAAAKTRSFESPAQEHT